MISGKLSVDLHLHSNHSIDGQNTIEEMCQVAIEKGFHTICFTEHFDMNPEDEGYGFFNYPKYSDDIERVRGKYSDQLKVLKGIEFSEPHLYPREFDDMSGRDFDFILASIHYLKDFGAYWVDEGRLQPGYPIQQLFESHYQTVLEAIEFGGFDGLAHIDFPRRYFSEKYEPDGLLNTILIKLVSKGIALEINSEPIHHGDKEVHPSDMICEMYVKLGGTKVTIGSDAHRCSRIGQDFEIVSKTIQRYNLQEVCFIQRQEKQLEQT